MDAFESEFWEYVGIKYSAAVSSGTAAMHLALRHLGVGPAPVKWSSPQRNGLRISRGENFTGQGDEVFASTLTFIGSVTPIVFQGATPVFIDCDRESWNLDPGLLEEELERCERNGKLPKAVVPVKSLTQRRNDAKIKKKLVTFKRSGMGIFCDFLIAKIQMLFIAMA